MRPRVRPVDGSALENLRRLGTRLRYASRGRTRTIGCGLKRVSAAGVTYPTVPRWR